MVITANLPPIAGPLPQPTWTRAFAKGIDWFCQSFGVSGGANYRQSFEFGAKLDSIYRYAHLAELWIIYDKPQGTEQITSARIWACHTGLTGLIACQGVDIIKASGHMVSFHFEFHVGTYLTAASVIE